MAGRLVLGKRRNEGGGSPFRFMVPVCGADLWPLRLLSRHQNVIRDRLRVRSYRSGDCQGYRVGSGPGIRVPGVLLGTGPAASEGPGPAVDCASRGIGELYECRSFATWRGSREIRHRWDHRCGFHPDPDCGNIGTEFAITGLAGECIFTDEISATIRRISLSRVRGGRSGSFLMDLISQILI